MMKIKHYAERTDARGRLIGLMNSGTWEEFNYLETRAGEKRGGHYHARTREVFFIIEGEVDIEVQRIDGGERTNYRVSAGEVIEIEPGELHTFSCLTETRWINVLSERFDERAPDMHVPGGS